MKRKWSVLLVAFVAVFIFSSLLYAGAATRASDYLRKYSASLTPKKGEQIAISVYIEGKTDVTSIGATTIYLYESPTGSGYSCIETFTSEDYPDMMGVGSLFRKEVVTYKGTAGYSYFAIVYCHAGNENGSDTKPYTTSVVKAIK